MIFHVARLRFIDMVLQEKAVLPVPAAGVQSAAMVGWDLSFMLVNINV